MRLLSFATLWVVVVSLAAAEPACVKESNTIVLPQSASPEPNPRFADTAARNYRLHSDLPAIDAGVPVDGITLDLGDDPRPRGACWDIGCYEFQGQETTPTPTPPPTAPPGSEFWALQFGGPNHTQGDAIGMAADGSVILAGIFQYAATLESNSGAELPLSAPSLAGFLAQYSPVGGERMGECHARRIPLLSHVQGSRGAPPWRRVRGGRDRQCTADPRRRATRGDDAGLGG